MSRKRALDRVLADEDSALEVQVEQRRDVTPGHELKLKVVPPNAFPRPIIGVNHLYISYVA